MEQPRTRFLNKQVWISELSSEEPWVGTIVGMFEEGGEWFYEVLSEKRRFALTVRSVNWIEVTKNQKRKEKKLKHKRRIGKLLRLVKNES